jgi:hypothetical protein
MKVSLMKKCLSFFIILFVLTNCIVLSFSDKTDGAMKNSSLEQILFAVHSHVDILSTMAQTNKNTQQKNNKKEQETNSYFYECLLPVAITLPSVSSISSLLVSNINIFISEKFVAEVEYPIKIPFLQCIFLILLLRLLFVVLPRSISVNYNKVNIDTGACIV